MDLQAPSAGRGHGVGGVEFSVERKTYRSRLTKETDHVGTGLVNGRARDFPELLIVVGGAVTKVDP